MTSDEYRALDAGEPFYVCYRGSDHLIWRDEEQRCWCYCTAIDLMVLIAPRLWITKMSRLKLIQPNYCAVTYAPTLAENEWIAHG